MQEAKLVVYVDRTRLENANRFAKEHDTTLSNLIDAYLARISELEPIENAPIVGRISGTLSLDVSRDDYRKHLDGKFRHAKSID